MAQIKGIYINLDSSKDRKERLENHLAKAGLTKQYTRFSAIKGDPEEASQKGLAELDFEIMARDPRAKKCRHANTSHHRR